MTEAGAGALPVKEIDVFEYLAHLLAARTRGDPLPALT